MQNKIAKTISVIFHPLLMPILGVFFLFNSNTYLSFLVLGAQIPIYTIVAISTLLLPLLSLPILIYGKYIQNIYLKNNNERVLPLVLTSIFFFLGYYIIAKITNQHFIFNSIKVFMIASLISLIFTTLITMKWKISAHMVGVGGILGLLIGLSMEYNVDLILYVLLMIMVSGLVAFSRLKLNAHNPSQVYFGYLLGFVVVFLVFTTLT